MKLTIVLVLLASLTAFAQESRGSGFLPNSVSVGADGEFESAPDTAVITCAISAQENTSQAAFDSASRLAEQLRQALRNGGVDPKTAELSRYNLYPVFDYKNPKQKVIAYRVGTSVTIKLKDFAKIAPVTESLAALNGITGQNMTYDLEEVDAAKQKAIDKAYERARAYAETLAKTSGRQLGALVSAAVDTQQAIPMIAYARTMAVQKEAVPQAPTEDFQASKVKVTAHVNAVFGLQ
ncbi:MAG TPA: SIMPL domain-containing protein [Terriglobales bacterium]|nr:SIMPL domain-containing protein [Terriglobales bacterium]